MNRYCGKISLVDDYGNLIASIPNDYFDNENKLTFSHRTISDIGNIYTMIDINKNIYSFKDAQGFRKDDNQKLNVKPIDAYIYHYGWVKHPEKMKNKVNNFHSYWHKGDELEKRLVKSDTFDYSEIDSLQKFTETHPKVMQERIKQKNWTFDYDISYNKANLKDKIKNISKKILGREIGEYRNYKII